MIRGLNWAGRGSCAGAVWGLLGCLYGVKLWRWVAPLWSPDAQLYRLCYRVVLDRFTELGLVRLGRNPRRSCASASRTSRRSSPS